MMKKRDLSELDGPKLTDGLGRIDRHLLGISRWLIFAAIAEQKLTIEELAVKAGLDPVATENVLLDESMPLSTKLITRLTKALGRRWHPDDFGQMSRTLSRGRRALKLAQANRVARQAAPASDASDSVLATRSGI